MASSLKKLKDKTICMLSIKLPYKTIIKVVSKLNYIAIIADKLKDNVKKMDSLE